MVVIEEITIDFDLSLIRCKRINYLINMEIIDDTIVIKYKCIRNINNNTSLNKCTISIYYFLFFISSNILHSCIASV